MKKKAVMIIIAVIVVIAIVCGIIIGINGGVGAAVSEVKGLFGSSVEVTKDSGKYSESNDTITTESLGDITYDRYVLWTNDTEDGEGVYYPTDSEATTLTVYTEEVDEDALATLEGDNALTYEEVYNILCDNVESGYINLEEISREMITIDDTVDGMTLKFYTNKDSEEGTVYEHWVTLFLYNGKLYYFTLSEPQQISLEIEYNIVITSIVCK